MPPELSLPLALPESASAGADSLGAGATAGDRPLALDVALDSNAMLDPGVISSLVNVDSATDSTSGLADWFTVVEVGTVGCSDEVARGTRLTK